MKKVALIAILLWCLGITPGQPVPAQGQAELNMAVAVVENVVDGDSFDVLYVSGGEGLPTRVKPYLIDAPEYTPVFQQCFGEQAQAYAERLLLGQTIWISHGGLTSIEHLLAFIYLDSDRQSLYQAIALSQGFARVDIKNPQEELFRARVEQLEQEARHAKRGLWGACT